MQKHSPAKHWQGCVKFGDFGQHPLQIFAFI
jgi:hypothetical protein